MQKSTLNVHYITKISFITTLSRQSLVQGKERSGLKELRFISSLTTFSRPFHMTASPPPPHPLIAKSPLSSFSTGPRYKNIVQGTSYILGINPGGWLEHVRAQSWRLTGRICDWIFGCAPKNSCVIAPVRRKTQSTVRLTYFRLYLRTRTRKTVYV